MAFWDYPSLASFPYLRLSLFIFGRHAGQEKGGFFSLRYLSCPVLVPLCGLLLFPFVWWGYCFLVHLPNIAVLPLPSTEQSCFAFG